MSTPGRPAGQPDHRLLLARILRLQARLPFPVTSRAMFGGTVAYADGRPFASLSTAGLAVTLSPADGARLIDEHGGVRLRYGPDQPQSRRYVVLPSSIVGNDDALAGWLIRAGRHAASLPSAGASPHRRGARRSDH